MSTGEPITAVPLFCLSFGVRLRGEIRILEVGNLSFFARVEMPESLAAYLLSSF